MDDNDIDEMDIRDLECDFGDYIINRREIAMKRNHQDNFLEKKGNILLTNSFSMDLLPNSILKNMVSFFLNVVNFSFLSELSEEECFQYFSN